MSIYSEIEDYLVTQVKDKILGNGTLGKLSSIIVQSKTYDYESDNMGNNGRSEVVLRLSANYVLKLANNDITSFENEININKDEVPGLTQLVSMKLIGHEAKGIETQTKNGSYTVIVEFEYTI